jgi:hypothetical protein
MKLLTYILEINLGLPEFKWALFISYEDFFSGNIYYNIVNSIRYFPIWFGCLKFLPNQKFLSRKVKFCMVKSGDT